MNKYSWEDDPFIKLCEQLNTKSSVPTQHDGQALDRIQSKYLCEVNNFKRRYKKLLNRISKRLHISEWHKLMKVGKFDLMFRCINPIIKNKDVNIETI